MFSSSTSEPKLTPSVGTRLEGLLLNEMENTFDPRTNNNSVAVSTSPPLCKYNINNINLKAIYFNIMFYSGPST